MSVVLYRYRREVISMFSTFTLAQQFAQASLERQAYSARPHAPATPQRRRRRRSFAPASLVGRAVAGRSDRRAAARG
jgi:hypothetical protein